MAIFHPKVLTAYNSYPTTLPHFHTLTLLSEEKGDNKTNDHSIKSIS
jgi:hypothetical protein